MSQKRSGSHRPGQNLQYPDDSVQSLIGNWWTVAEDREVRRGQLLWTHVPFIDWLPYELVPEARSSSTEHERVLFRLEQRRLSQGVKATRLPIAALPQNPGETYSVYRTKFRPVLVLSMGGNEIDPALTRGAARWQSVRTILVAPYFGADRSDQRGGWKPEFILRIRHCEYPQFFWDQLPIGRATKESILRFDQLQPIGRNHEAFGYTRHRLSDAAMDLVDEWFMWYFSGQIDTEGDLQVAREELSAFV